MKHFLYITALLLFINAISIRADLLECDKKKLPSLSDVGIKITSSEDSSAEHEVRDFFKNVGCQIKKGATKVGEQAKKLGVELKEGAIKLGEKAKNLGENIKTKFTDFKETLKQDSSEIQNQHVLANVEIINPDMLKAEQQCGHGYILDSLGNCSKLRK